MLALVKLLDLEPDDRSTELQALAAIVPGALHDGWQRWEIDELLKAVARRRGFALNAADVAAVMALAAV